MTDEQHESKTAQSAGWKDEDERQRFLDSMRKLSESIKRLAEALQKKALQEND